ncbi:hypothetical protein HPP92_006922 [Vanilla planifolia]|uniref:Uncharacterized protein n=1 Tax=Vanilla planifolia TaxID=51239 RepID=A0A835V780_VANPL|nr:hypothetical protein HPP92_006922 [Vanilla planifolia]
MHRWLFIGRVSFSSSTAVSCTGHLRSLHSSPSFPLIFAIRCFSLSALPHPHPSPSRRQFPSSTRPSNDISPLLREDGVATLSFHWISSFRDPSSTVNSFWTQLERSDLWILAYQKVYADETGSYLPKSTITRPTLEDLLALCNAVLDGRFRCCACLDLFIRPPGDRTDLSSLAKRKIGILLITSPPRPFQDRIFQEAL